MADELLRQRILLYLAAIYRENPEAEVSGAELCHELQIDASTVRERVAELARQALVEWDPLLANIWLRITDKGMALTKK
jgi:Mn-dependent DtxR family transcriptional regulator